MGRPYQLLFSSLCSKMSKNTYVFINPQIPSLCTALYSVVWTHTIFFIPNIVKYHHDMGDTVTAAGAGELQPTLLIPAPAVSNQLHLSGRRTSRTGRQTDSVLIHLIECSPLIGPQIQRQVPIGPDIIYTRCRKLHLL